MSTQEFTDRQRREAAHFNNKEWLEEVTLDFMDQPGLGPWNPYWHLHNQVRQARAAGAQMLLVPGCGRGTQCLQFAQMGYRVRGYDISDRVVDNANYLAQKYGLAERVECSVQPAERLGYADNTFDVAAGQNVLHHFDIAPAMRELARVLKPGGLAIFKEPWDTPFRTWIRRQPPLSWLAPVGQKNLWDKSVYQDTVDEKQLTPQAAESIRGMFPDLKILRWRLLAKLAIFTRDKRRLQRLDWALFKVCPPLRRIGDEVVLVMHKPK